MLSVKILNIVIIINFIIIIIIFAIIITVFIVNTIDNNIIVLIISGSKYMRIVIVSQVQSDKNCLKPHATACTTVICHSQTISTELSFLKIFLLVLSLLVLASRSKHTWTSRSMSLLTPDTISGIRTASARHTNHCRCAHIYTYIYILALHICACPQFSFLICWT
jgi:hypothetical protein